MEKAKVAKCVLLFLVSAVLFPLSAWAEEKLPLPETYVTPATKTHEIKKNTDDPTDMFVTHPLKDAVPPEIWDRISFDREAMAKETAEVLGFTAPERVGKIAPEIKPGKYTYKDLEKYPGLKELFPPEYLVHIGKPGPPFSCTVEEFEIIPTRQQYHPLPFLEATKRNLGKTKLDKDGYIIPRSWEGGIPFPRPSGKFKAQQVYYNFEKRADSYNNNYFIVIETNGIDRNLKRDEHGKTDVMNMRLMGRILFPPFGWFDERAEKNGEFSTFAYVTTTPRISKGMGVLQYHYDDPNKMDTLMVYLPSMRRIRMMSATDSQDPTGDGTYDDAKTISQKITPLRYPYKFEIIEEREYLVAIGYNSSPVYVDSKDNWALRGVSFQRRPFYVLQMTQLDPTYQYSKRIIYLDQETLASPWSVNYDQKGQKWRSQRGTSAFHPDVGSNIVWGGLLSSVDYIDMHSTWEMAWAPPAASNRKHFSMGYLIRRGK